MTTQTFLYEKTIYAEKVVRTGRTASVAPEPNGHDNNLFDIKLLSLRFDYAFHLCSVFAWFGSKVSLAFEAAATRGTFLLALETLLSDVAGIVKPECCKCSQEQALQQNPWDDVAEYSSN